MKLRSKPTAEVTVTVTSDDTGAATVSDDSLTFTTTSWNDEQTITVSGVDDSDRDTETFDISLSASGGGYDGVTGTLAMIVTDDDDPNLAVNPPTLTVDENSTATFRVKLATLPTADVTVTVTSDDTGAATVSDGSLEFTTSTWDTYQPITVTGVQDADAADEPVTITLVANGGDYVNVRATVSVTVDDTEVADLMIEETSLEIDEGGTGTFTVKLTSQPTGAVTVTVTSDDMGAATLSTGTLSFSSTTWNDEQTVTVRGVQDADSLEESVNITLLASGGDYGGKMGAVAVTVIDSKVYPARSESDLVFDKLLSKTLANLLQGSAHYHTAVWDCRD